MADGKRVPSRVAAANVPRGTTTVPRVKRRLGITAFVAAVGIAEIAFAVQIRTWHGRGSWTGNPENKAFVASWLASEMWVNPGLLLVGGVTLILAVVFYLLSPRPAKR
jgi:hypothetical protein